MVVGRGGDCQNFGWTSLVTKFTKIEIEIFEEFVIIL